MPATAPDVTSTVTQKHVSFRLIDWTGDRGSDSIQVPVGATASQVEALKDAYGAISSANVYAVEIPSLWNDIPDSGDAIEAPRGEMSNVLNVLVKKATGESMTVPVRAPINEIFVANSDDVDPTNADLATYFGALLAALGSGWEIVSVRYTGRKQTNQATPI
jgi:hypothetical protein